MQAQALTAASSLSSQAARCSAQTVSHIWHVWAPQQDSNHLLQHNTRRGKRDVFRSLHNPRKCRERCTKQRQSILAQAGSSNRQRVTQELPIFPLGMVAMPGTVTPLIIFEARYRVLFSTLLAGDDEVEEGLINEQSPFCGSKKFGLNHVNNDGTVCQVGVLLRIEGHKLLGDGRMIVVNRGMSRYKILKVKQEHPVVIAEVEMMSEEDDTSPKARQLAAELVPICKQLLELLVKMRKVKADETELNPPELTDLYPTKLSFFVASLLLDNQMEQQALLTLDSTVERLEIEKVLIENTLKYMSARYALQGAFAPSAADDADDEGDKQTTDSE